MNIYVSNLSYNVNDGDLKQLFTEYGEVSSAKVIIDRETGRSRGFGFVEMPNKDEAIKAMNALHEAEYDGKVLNVNEARPKEDKPRGNFGGGNFNRGGYNSDKRNSNKRW
ncbi:MAG TPA: RNA-binding protein [Chitinophagales bacterium]|nr:RNA-binding protein [Chitinophagales bacterium]